MGLCNPVISQKMNYRLKSHRCSTVCMDGQLILHNTLFSAGLFDETSCQCRRFSMCNHPAHNVMAEDIHDNIEVEMHPFGRSLALGNIPGPDLVSPVANNSGLL